MFRVATGWKLEFKVSSLSAVRTTARGAGLITAQNSKFQNRYKSISSMYIHGGRDLKEGPLSSLWRINLTSVAKLL